MWSLPAKTAMLLDPDPEVVKSCLKTLSQWFDLLQTLERRALSERTIHQMLSDLYWPKMQWVRMILTGLWEAEFKSVPPWVHAKVLSAWRGLTYNKPTEDFNRLLRNMERVLNMSSTLSRQHRWLTMVRSDILKDCDRGRVLITNAARVASHGAKLESATFLPEEKPCNLDPSLLNMLSTSTWQSKSPQTSNILILSWMALNTVGDDIGKISRLWLAGLCQVGSVIHSKTQKATGLVIHACIYGVLCLRLKPLAVHEQTFITLEPLAKFYDFHVVHDQDEWTAMEFRFITPGSSLHFMQSHDGPGAASIGPVLERVGTPKPLVAFASLYAFRGLTTLYLSKLFDRLMIPSPKKAKPSTERALCEAIIRFVNPSFSDERIKEICEKHRFTPETGEISTLLADENNQEFVEEIFDEADEQEINSKIDDLVSKIQAHERACNHSGGAASSSGGPSSSAPGAPGADEASSSNDPPKKRLKPTSPFVSKYDHVHVKALLPTVEGCSASCEAAWDGRWRCTYPGSFPGVSKSFGTSFTEQEALYHVLSWAWRRHEEAGGEPCPFGYKWEDVI
jgi:hypothetical protein